MYWKGWDTSINEINEINSCNPNNNKQCTPKPKGIIIFGTKVLKSLYTIFDYKNKRIGFANNLITNYTKKLYKNINKKSCIPHSICNGDDIFNITYNKCDINKQCKKYWAWTYNINTHDCVLKKWVYATIPIIWIIIMIILLIIIKFQMWIDNHISYTAIKV